MNTLFDPAQMHRALQLAAQATENNELVDNGLTDLTAMPTGDAPIAWVDAAGQVWPHEAGAPLHPGIVYLRTQEEVQAALQQSRGAIVVTSTMPSSVVPLVTGEQQAPMQPNPTPQVASRMASARAAMMQTFANPAGAAVRSE